MTNEEIIAILSGMGNQRENAHSNIDSLISNNNNENKDFFDLTKHYIDDDIEPIDYIINQYYNKRKMPGNPPPGAPPQGYFKDMGQVGGQHRDVMDSLARSNQLGLKQERGIASILGEYIKKLFSK
jgi:hypothetical protein